MPREPNLTPREPNVSPMRAESKLRDRMMQPFSPQKEENEVIERGVIKAIQQRISCTGMSMLPSLRGASAPANPWLSKTRSVAGRVSTSTPLRAKSVKSNTADSEHTPHPFYSHLSQSSCVKRRLGHSSSATYSLRSQNYYASNTNPQSGSSYSLRVLKSLHEIFRASFLFSSSG